MAKRIRREKCAFFYRKSKIGDFCLCDKNNPLKLCNCVCELYMSKQEYEAFMAQVLEEESAKNKD